MQNFRNLKVWEKAHALTLAIYRSSKTFPRDEIYGLTSQMRRASVSIGANIAEGTCRKGDVEFARFLQMAAGSASELGLCQMAGGAGLAANECRCGCFAGGPGQFVAIEEIKTGGGSDDKARK